MKAGDTANGHYTKRFLDLSEAACGAGGFTFDKASTECGCPAGEIYHLTDGKPDGCMQGCSKHTPSDNVRFFQLNEVGRSHLNANWLCLYQISIVSILMFWISNLVSFKPIDQVMMLFCHDQFRSASMIDSLGQPRSCESCCEYWFWSCPLHPGESERNPNDSQFYTGHHERCSAVACGNPQPNVGSHPDIR